MIKISYKQKPGRKPKLRNGAFSVNWGEGKAKVFSDAPDAFKFGESLNEFFTVYDIGSMPYKRISSDRDMRTIIQFKTEK